MRDFLRLAIALVMAGTLLLAQAAWGDAPLGEIALRGSDVRQANILDGSAEAGDGSAENEASGRAASGDSLHPLVLAPIDGDGGVLEGDDVRMQVPPGAVSKPMEIGIYSLSGTYEIFESRQNVTGGVRDYRFLPAGADFAVPAEISLPYDEDALRWEPFEQGPSVSGGSFSNFNSTQEAGFVDINGDGLPDHVLKRTFSKNARIKRNKMGDDSGLFVGRIDSASSDREVIGSHMNWNRAEGRLRSRTDPNGLMERHVYDDFGRLLKMYTPYDTDIPAVSHEYMANTRGSLNAKTANKVSTNPDDDKLMHTLIKIDGLGRPIYTAKSGFIAHTDREGGDLGWNVSAAVSYDKKGRIVKTGRPSFQTEDEDSYPSAPLLEEDFITEAVYDDLDRPIKTIYPSENWGDVYSRPSYRIDGERSLKIITDPLGRVEVWIEDVDPATRYIPFRFTSKELDRETGLYYHGARYYEPKVSRWMSADPAGFALSNPNRSEYSVIEAANWYAYVSSNPVNYVDPTGMLEVMGESIPREMAYWLVGLFEKTAELASMANFRSRKTPDGYENITEDFSDLISQYKRSGLNVRIFRRGEEYFVAFPAMNSFSIKDWSAAFRQAQEGETEGQFKNAFELVGKLLEREDINVSNLTLIGTSLGGGQAAYVGSQMGIKTITFNAAGVHPDNVGPYIDMVTNFHMMGDYLTKMQNTTRLPSSIGKQIRMKPTFGDLVIAALMGPVGTIYLHSIEVMQHGLKKASRKWEALL